MLATMRFTCYHSPMGKLQRAFNEKLASLPVLLLERMVDRKLMDAQLSFAPDVKAALIQHILGGKLDEFVWHDDQAGDNIPQLRANLTFGKADFDEVELLLQKLPELISDTIVESARKSGLVVFTDLRKQWPIEGSLQEQDLIGFRSRLESRWGEGLNLLRMLLTACVSLRRLR